MADFEVSGQASMDPDKLVGDITTVIDKLDELSAKIDEVGIKIDELADKSIDVTVNIIGQDKLDELILFLDDIESHDYQVNIKLNIEGMDEFDATKLKIDELEAAPHDVDIKVKTDGADTATSEVDALGKALDGEKKKADDAKNSTDGLSFSMMMLAPAVAPLASILLSTAGGALGLGAAFATMIPPLALAAYGTDQVYQSVSKVWTGLNAATQAALLNSQSMQQSIGILDKNSAAFKAMDTSMQHAVLQYTFLEQQLAAFKKTMEPVTTVIFANAIGLLAQMIGILTPAAMTAGTALGALLEDFSNRLNDPVFQKFFKDMASNIGTLVTVWGNAIMNIVEGLTSIIDAFMPLGVSMSTGFNEMTVKFDTWAQHVGESKGFKQFVSTVEADGPIILNILGQVVGIIVKLVAALGTSPVDTGVLKFLDTLLQHLNSFMGANPGLVRVESTLALIGIAAAKFGPALAGALSFIATPVGAIVAALALLAIGFLYMYNTSEKFRQWVDNSFGPGLKKLEGVFAGVKQWAISIWPDIQKIWQIYGANILKIILDVWNYIVGIISGAVKVVEGIIDLFTGILTGHWSLAWKGIQKILEGVWEMIQTATKTALNIVLQLLDMFVKWLSSMFLNVIKTIGGFFAGLYSTVTTWIANMISRVISDVVQWMTNMASSIANGVGTVINWFTSLPGKILNAIGNLGSLLWNAGVQVITGLINGFTSMLGSVQNWFGGLMNDILSWKGPPSKDAVFLHDSGALLIQGLIDGMESKYTKVQSSLNGLTKNIGNTFGQKFTTDISAQLNASMGGMGLGGGAMSGAMPGGSGGNTMSFANGAIQIYNAVPETAGTTLTRVLQNQSSFGMLQGAMGTPPAAKAL